MILRVYPAVDPSAALLLAHGAGAGQASPFIVRVAMGLSQRGLATATFDFPYMASGRKVPDRPAVLEAAWKDAIAAGRLQFPALPLFTGGKSMGGRIATQVAAQGTEGPVSGVILLGYPLHPPGRPGQRRDAHLPAIREPLLFVQGSRDAFGSGDEIRSLLPTLRAAALHEIEGADHSFKVPGGAGRQEPVLSAIMDRVAAWARERLPPP